jgi:hypothetical protein
MEPFPPSLLASTNIASAYDAPGAAGGPDLFIDIDRFHETFCADLPDDIAWPMAVSQTATVRGRVHGTRHGGRMARPADLVSRLRARHAIPPDCERMMAKRMNATTESVDGSHVAFVSHPDVAAGLILKALSST